MRRRADRVIMAGIVGQIRASEEEVHTLGGFREECAFHSDWCQDARCQVKGTRGGMEGEGKVTARQVTRKQIKQAKRKTTEE